MPTRLEFIQRAQARIGDEPILSEDDPGADTHIAIFEGVLEDLLSRHPWSFSAVTRRLTRLSEAPPAHWRYFYQLPADMIGAPRAAYERDDAPWPFTAWELTENRFATNAEQVWLRYAKRPELVYLPGYFAELLTVAIMAQFALSIREDSPMHERLRQVAFGSGQLDNHGGLLEQCRTMNDQGQPSPVVAEGVNPLLEARR
jgi:hypothetical protein